MDANDKTFASSAGHVVFPRGPEDLRNRANRPACLNPLAGPVCRICHLDLGNPAADALAAASSRAADALDERLALIGMIRRESAQAAQVTRVASPPVAPLVALPVVPSVNAPVPPVTAAVTRPTAPHHGRSSVQIILLVVGVGLLSIAAIFFLVYAFITYGILVRSAIIATITVAAFIVAPLLRRRHLRSTAEGIAVFGAVRGYRRPSCSERSSRSCTASARSRRRSEPSTKLCRGGCGSASVACYSSCWPHGTRGGSRT